jgi:quinohemoprotein ethanol dehydrogenase
LFKVSRDGLDENGASRWRCSIYGCAFGQSGADAGVLCGLGYVSTETIANLKDFVFKRPVRDQGMPDFTGKLKDEDVVKIQAFIQGTADAVRPQK